MVTSIWLPNICMDKYKLLQFLRLQNFRIPINYLVVFKEEEFQAKCQPFLLRIKGECLEALGKVDYKVRFGVKNAKR